MYANPNRAYKKGDVETVAYHCLAEYIHKLSKSFSSNQLLVKHMLYSENISMTKAFYINVRNTLLSCGNGFELTFRMQIVHITINPLDIRIHI